MKSSFKIIAAAVALLAAGSSFAQVVTPTVVSSTGSDMLFIAYDLANNTSFTEDLGITYSAFSTSTAATLGQIFAIGSSAGFQNYVSTTMSVANAAGEGYANGLQGTLWAVLGGEQNTTLKGLDTTIASGTAVSNSTGSQLSPITNSLTNMTGNMGLNNGSYTAAQLQAGIFSAASDYTNAGYSVGSAAYNKRYGNSVGATAQMVNYSFTGSVTAPRTPSVFSANGSPIAVAFDGTNLSFVTATVAAVPEPTSYAMMLAGLLMIGTLAVRRRNSK